MSVDNESIGDILSGKSDAAPVEKTEPVAEVKTEAAAPSAAPEKKEPVRDDAGKFAKTEAEAKAEVPEVKADKPRPDVAAIIDERRKRQAIEKELAALKAGKPQERPSIFDNEDEAIRSRIDEATRPLREAHYNLSMKYARQEHGDAFNHAEQAFMDAAEQNPALYDGLKAAPDPGSYVYLHGTFHREMSEVGGDILKYRDKVTGETKTQLAARDEQIKTLTAELESLRKSHVEDVPRNLNNRSSVATAGGDADPESITQLVRFGNNQR